MARETLTVTVTKLLPSGALECSAIFGGEYHRRVYYYYTKREAIREFRAMVRERSKERR